MLHKTSTFENDLRLNGRNGMTLFKGYTVNTIICLAIDRVSNSIEYASISC